VKKLSIILAGLVGITSIIPCYSFSNSISHLSTDEAIIAIWKMKYEDICSLHKTVFPHEHNDKTPSEKETYISKMYKAGREKIFGKTITIITQVLDTLKSASIVEQEMIQDAIHGSYKEYELQLNTVETLFVALLFPIGIFYMYQMRKDHIEKIEAKRAGSISVENTVTMNTASNNLLPTILIIVFLVSLYVFITVCFNVSNKNTTIEYVTDQADESITYRDCMAIHIASNK
jgi:hypothetical protein